MKKSMTKLALNRETVRALGEHPLAIVHGGRINPTVSICQDPFCVPTTTSQATCVGC
jgi:hypothetical protein